MSPNARSTATAVVLILAAVGLIAAIALAAPLVGGASIAVIVGVVIYWKLESHRDRLRAA